MYKELANRIGNVLESPRRQYVPDLGKEMHLERQLQAELSKRNDTGGTGGTDWLNNRKLLSTHILSRTSRDMDTFDRALNVELGKRLEGGRSGMTAEVERLVPKTPRPQQRHIGVPAPGPPQLLLQRGEVLVHQDVNAKFVYHPEPPDVRQSAKKKYVTWDLRLHSPRSWWLWIVFLSILILAMALVIQTFRHQLSNAAARGDDRNTTGSIYDGGRTDSYETTDASQRQKRADQENTKFKGNIIIIIIIIIVLLSLRLGSLDFLRVQIESFRFEGLVDCLSLVLIWVWNREELNCSLQKRCLHKPQYISYCVRIGCDAPYLIV